MDNLPSSNKMTESSGDFLRILKSLVLTTLLLITSVAPIFAATEGTYEYNDFNLYSTGGSYYTSGAFRSNNGSLSEFSITINATENTWTITDGTTSGIPLPTGITIDYTDDHTFLTTAYAVINGTTYNFTYIPAQPGIFYLQHIPAGPYYYPVNIYLPTEGTAVNVPANPIATYRSSDGVFEITPAGYYTEVYFTTDEHLAGNMIDSCQGAYKVQEGGDGYYYFRIRYYVNHEYAYTDYSSRLYGSYVEVTNDPETTDEWIIKYIKDSRHGFQNAVNTVTDYIKSMGTLITGLLSWMPSDVVAVFWSVVVIGFILGFFIKH